MPMQIRLVEWFFN